MLAWRYGFWDEWPISIILEECPIAIAALVDGIAFATVDVPQISGELVLNWSVPELVGNVAVATIEAPQLELVVC